MQTGFLKIKYPFLSVYFYIKCFLDFLHSNYLLQIINLLLSAMPTKLIYISLKMSFKVNVGLCFGEGFL